MRFQQKTLDLIGAANTILAEYDGPLTLRQIFYRLVAAQIITNEEKSYKRLSEVLTNARIAGLVDDSRIIDRTRQSLRVPCWSDLGSFLKQMGKSYRREKWTGQPLYVEVWCEKDALAGVLEPVTEEYEVVLYPCRGYNSYSALREAAERITYATESKAAIILYLGDFDPSGQDMARDIRQRLESYFATVVDLQIIALTPEQIAEYNLPPAPAKKTDSRTAGFVARHGEDTVELDALPPDVLQALVMESIEQLTDKSAFTVEQAKEQEEVTRLQAIIGLQ